MKDMIIGLCLFMMTIVIAAIYEPPIDKVCVTNIQYESIRDRVTLKLCNGDVKIIKERNLFVENNEYFIKSHSLIIPIIIVILLLGAAAFFFSSLGFMNYGVKKSR